MASVLTRLPKATEQEIEISLAAHNLFVLYLSAHLIPSSLPQHFAFGSNLSHFSLPLYFIQSYVTLPNFQLLPPALERIFWQAWNFSCWKRSVWSISLVKIVYGSKF